MDKTHRVRIADVSTSREFCRFEPFVQHEPCCRYLGDRVLIPHHLKPVVWDEMHTGLYLHG